jgi:hypothetical protein
VLALFTCYCDLSADDAQEKEGGKARNDSMTDGYEATSEIVLSNGGFPLDRPCSTPPAES